MDRGLGGEIFLDGQAHYGPTDEGRQSGLKTGGSWALVLKLESRGFYPRQQQFRAMNGAHLASPIREELGYAHRPQLGSKFIARLGTKFGAH